MMKTRIYFGVHPPLGPGRCIFPIWDSYGSSLDSFATVPWGDIQDAVYRRKSSGKDIYPATCDGVSSNFGVLARLKQNLSFNAMRGNTY